MATVRLWNAERKQTKIFETKGNAHVAGFSVEHEAPEIEGKKNEQGHACWKIYTGKLHWEK